MLWLRSERRCQVNRSVKLPPGVRQLLELEKSAPYKEWQSKVKRARCPRCKTKGRMLTGPFYNRGALTCCECGHKMRVKVTV